MESEACDGSQLRTSSGEMSSIGFGKDIAAASENYPCTSTTSTSARFHPYNGRKSSLENVARLLSWREVAPTVRRPLKKLWVESVENTSNSLGLKHEATSAKHALVTWLESESLKHCAAKYCPLQPAPRSTIAAAFSPDGTILASTHGDHTVKIICCKTGLCLKTLCGHRRTPWVVRFHPRRSDILASGSLDNEVKIWDASTAECIASHDFYRPIASIAFHAQGDLLAVASGHKLYVWQYSRQEEDSASPAIVLRTRRSLRAVHFHPHGAPLLLTAEVNGLDAPDCPMTLATSPGYLNYPRPAIFFTPVQQAPSSSRPSDGEEEAPVAPAWFLPAAWVSDNESGTMHGETMMVGRTADAPISEVIGAGFDSEALEVGVPSSEAVPMDVSPRPARGGALSTHEGAFHAPYTVGGGNFESGVDMLLRAADGQALADGPVSTSPLFVGVENSLPPVLPRSETRSSLSRVTLLPNLQDTQADTGRGWPSSGVSNNFNVQVLIGDNMPPVMQQRVQVNDQSGWDLPLLQGWVMGQSQAGLVQPSLHSSGAAQHGILVVPGMPVEAREFHAPLQQQQQYAHWNSNALLAAGPTRTTARSGNSRCNRTRGASQRASTIGTPGGSNRVHLGILHGFASRDSNTDMLAVETAAPQVAMAAAAAAAELPCTVKLRIWPHDMKHPSAVLDPETCRLTIPHAVLCSEMGAHFSPCGRFLAACVACVLPPLDSDVSSNMRAPLNESSATSPTRHPISAQQVIYELRIYSLEEATFGVVLASRAIRAAHCLTSIQFSPTSGHILLAYGRRHSSLLRSIVVNGTSTVPIFTILEVYRVSDMELVKVLPSAEDEVNVACFHPLVGGGLAYGTKEGRLRIFKHDRSSKVSGTSRTSFEDHVFDAG